MVCYSAVSVVNNYKKCSETFQGDNAMYDYEEACPLSKAASILCERWTLQIVREMLFGASRFSEFERYLPRLSPTLLNTRLKTLEQQGIIIRRRVPDKKGYEYQLTPYGRALRPVVSAIGRWGLQGVFDHMDPQQLNASTIVRDFGVALRMDELPSGDCVIQFTVTGEHGAGKKFLLVRDRRVEVCDEDMGHDVDVYLTADLLTFGNIWFGKLAIADALNRDLLKVVGAPFYRQHVSKWLGISELASG